MSSSLALDCERAARRVRSLRIKDFRYSIEGDRVILEGDALAAEGIDSAVKVFRGTSAREVVNRLRHAPPDPAHPGSIRSPDGYVHIEEMGPNAARLAETITWEVAPGDSIESIAEAVYGDRAKADRIASANRNQLSSTRHIHAGQRLRIPPP